MSEDVWNNEGVALAWESKGPSAQRLLERNVPGANDPRVPNSSPISAAQMQEVFGVGAFHSFMLPKAIARALSPAANVLKLNSLDGLVNFPSIPVL
jgi:hypothetical protein